jgi:hypothetical protein
MGAKTALLAVCDGDGRDVLRAARVLDREASKRFAEKMTGDFLDSAEDGSLGENTNPADGFVFATSWPGLEILSDSRVALDRLSELPARSTRVSGRRVIVHAMHSVVDWFAFGVWDDGRLVRALSVSADHQIIEDPGERLPFETPFWEGERPVDDGDDEPAYPLPFHPLELGEEALHAFFGFRLEGAPTEVDPFTIPLAGFRVARGRSLVQRVRGWWGRQG